MSTLGLVPWESIDLQVCVAFYARNRAHLAPWEPHREEGFFSVDEQAALQAQAAARREQDNAYAYAVMFDGELAGRVTLSDVARGVFQSAHIGYLTDQALGGRGIATRAVAGALTIAFHELRLHRVQAAVLPRNRASVRVIEKNGFTRVGLSPRYLLIAGTWEDHVLYAITAEDAGSSARP